jgi:internalin A
LGALSLQDCAIEGTGFEALKGLTKLKEFGLFKSTAGDKAIESLAGSKEMTKLKLRASGVTSQGIQKHVGSFPKLTAIDLGETSIDDLALEAIAKTTIDDLNLLRTPVTNAGVSHLIALKLKRLNLDDIRGINDDVFESLVQMPTLEFLHLGKTDVSDGGIKKLAVLLNLKDLLINDTSVSDDAIAKLKQALSGLKVKR